MKYTVTVNAIDPFVQITQLYDGVWSFISRSPGMGGDARSYLVCGTEKAMVIDTGFGIGNLKGLVGYFTDLPVIVVNTHFHGDHTLGNAQFGKVYIHELDLKALEDSVNHPRPEVAIARDTFYTAADVIKKEPYVINPIKTGHIFDLGGGHEIEVFHTPGHSPGGISLLEKKRRMLFSGDAIVYTPIYLFNFKRPGGEAVPVPKYGTVEDFRDSLGVLKARKCEFDGIFPGHHNMNLSTDYIDDLYFCCEKILTDPTKFDEMMKLGFGGEVKLRIHDNGLIAFSDDRIYKI